MKAVGDKGNDRRRYNARDMVMSTIKAANVKLKRAYDPPEPGDGVRILVDRLWPRGVKKTEAAIETASDLKMLAVQCTD